MQIGSKEVLSNLENFTKRPFNKDMDLFHWGLFVGVIGFFILIWIFIIKFIEETI